MSAIDPGRLFPTPGFRRIAARLEAAGYEAWAVGGAIRDAYVRQIGTKPDLPDPGWEDLTTDARPEDVMRLFPRTVPVGVSHGTVKVLDGDDGYEVTTFRRDVETDGRHARVAFADSIGEDLSRRDFTANAIAWRPASDEVRDDWDGAEDIEDGILRAVGEPEARFREDYLRILRGFRFAGRFEWAIEVRTDEAMREAVDGLSGLSGERVREELLKVMADPKPSTALELYATCGALGHWYPELVELAAAGDAWRSALGAVDAAPAHAANVRLASLLVAASETPEGRAEAAESLLSRLKFSNADRRYITRLARLYLPFVGALDSAAEHRRWLASVGDAWEDLFELHFAVARAAGEPRAKRYLEATRERVREEREGDPALDLAGLAVKGDDLLALGMSPGPIVRMLLEELLEQVLEDPARNEREPLLEEARRLIEIGSLAEASRPRDTPAAGNGLPEADD
ncbi:CCA tRNA nucleotidyltransferase [Candidatus Palauibacter sp.]|uniref:CCA tRNA nucleotidyltransferase n=1 Tax=Candidatus Palauibacter sp. TaxID=3101350 RepID=UPI003D13B0BC